MLPGSSIGVGMSSGKVQLRPDRGRENAANDRPDTVALGPGDADRGLRTLRARPQCGGADELPDRVAGRRRTPCSRDRMAGRSWAGSGAQEADVGHEAQVDRTGWVGKKRLRVEALLAAAASSVPPPIDDLMPDLLLRDEVPEDLPWLLRLLPRADVYLQDEVEIALHPTLTRVWSTKGRRRQRLVETPGNNEKQYGFGLVDWRDGWLDWERAPGRRAAPFCAQLRRAVARSQARGRIAMVLLDNLGIHTAKGSLLLRQLLTELRGHSCWSIRRLAAASPHGQPARGAGAGAMTILPVRGPVVSRRMLSSNPSPSRQSARSMKSVLPSSPPSMQAKHARSVSTRCSTSPPSRTRSTLVPLASMVEHQMA